MEYDEDLYKTLESYYKILENVGYYDKPLDRVLFLDFLNDFLYHCYDFITNDDVRLINNIIPCQEDCLVNIHLLNYNNRELISNDDILKESETLRKTEDSQTRNTENLDYRIIE